MVVLDSQCESRSSSGSYPKSPAPSTSGAFYFEQSSPAPFQQPLATTVTLRTNPSACYSGTSVTVRPTHLSFNAVTATVRVHQTVSASSGQLLATPNTQAGGLRPNTFELPAVSGCNQWLCL